MYICYTLYELDGIITRVMYAIRLTLNKNAIFVCFVINKIIYIWLTAEKIFWTTNIEISLVSYSISQNSRCYIDVTEIKTRRTYVTRIMAQKSLDYRYRSIYTLWRMSRHRKIFSNVYRQCGRNCYATATQHLHKIEVKAYVDLSVSIYSGKPPFADIIHS